jgi:DegV family protein with EDD domain
MAERRVAVVCESTACLPPELVQRYGIKVVPIPFVIDGTTYHDGVDITAAAFYDRLASLAELPKTSPPEPGAYLDAWQSANPDVNGIVVVTVAGRIGTFERSARLARDLMAEKFPATQVRIVDSGSAAMGQGFVALAAAKAACRGLSLDDVCAEAEATAGRVNLVVALDTLRYLARTSRIPQIASIVSSLLDLKPIIRFVNGEVQPVARVRSRKRSLEQLVATVCELTCAGQPLHVAIHHARARSEAEHVLALLSERRSFVECYLTEFTPVMGAYCGPGLVGVALYPAHENEAV